MSSIREFFNTVPCRDIAEGLRCQDVKIPYTNMPWPGLDLYRNEKSCRHGVKSGMATCFIIAYQSMQINSALSLAKKACSSAGYVWKPLFNNRFLSAAACILPMTTASLLASTSLKEKAPRVYRAVNFLHDNTSKLAWLASGVSCAALIAFGQPFFGAAGLTLTAGVLLCEKRWLPLSMRVGLRHSLTFITDVVFSIARPENYIVLAYGIYSHMNSFWNERQASQALAQRTVPQVSYTAALHAKENAKIDVLHVISGPPLKTVDDSLLKTSLEDLCKTTEDEEIREGLILLKEKIVDRVGLFEEPWSYSSLEDQAKNILINLLSLSEEDRNKYIQQLSNIGRVCYAGNMLGDLEKLRLRIFLSTKHTTLEEQLQAVLLRFRTELHEQAIEKISKKIKEECDLPETLEIPGILSETIDRAIPFVSFFANVTDTSCLGALPSRSINNPTLAIPSAESLASIGYSPQAIESRIEEALDEGEIDQGLFESACKNWRDSHLTHWADANLSTDLMILIILAERGILHVPTNI